MRTTSIPVALLAACIAAVTCSSASAFITDTSDDFDTAITNNGTWVNVGAVPFTALFFDSNSANDFDKTDQVNTQANPLDGNAIVGDLLGDTEPLGDGLLADGGLRLNTSNAIQGDEAAGLTIGGTMDTARKLTWNLTMYNDNSSFNRADFQLYNLTDNTVLASSGSTLVQGINHVAYVPVDVSLTYHTQATDVGDQLQIRIVEDDNSTARDPYIDNYSLTSVVTKPTIAFWDYENLAGAPEDPVIFRANRPGVALNGTFLHHRVGYYDETINGIGNDGEPPLLPHHQEPGAAAAKALVAPAVGTGDTGGFHANTDGRWYSDKPAGGSHAFGGNSLGFSGANDDAGESYLQFHTSTLGFENVEISFDIMRDNAAIGTDWTLEVSTQVIDEGNTEGMDNHELQSFLFTPLDHGAQPFTLGAEDVYSTFTFDLSGIIGVNDLTHQEDIFIRLVNPGTTNSSGRVYVDNVRITGDAITFLAGDFNMDFVVDGLDFLEWQRGLGTLYTHADLAGWEATYGMVGSALSAAVASVPEPGSMALLLLGATMLPLARRRKFSAEQS